tara:strand:- start:162 stop:908 length:747 start_codon:yes stop_codon:yes gene_type:complete
MNLPLISIITVVYNDEKGLLNTLNSVVNQTFHNIESIVIDGNSTDGTKMVIKSFKDQINYFVSEPDKGIYDAMNKGIKQASGDWVIFMNAGDLFYSNETISDVFKIENPNDYDILYGDTIGVHDNGEIEYIRPLDLSLFWKHIPICHQSTFINLKLHKEYLYDLNYKVSSVYDFLYNRYISGDNFKYINLPISKYNMNGYSSHSLLWLWDYIRISLKYSKGKRHKVIFKIGSYSIMRLIKFLKKKKMV